VWSGRGRRGDPDDCFAANSRRTAETMTPNLLGYIGIGCPRRNGSKRQHLRGPYFLSPLVVGGFALSILSWIFVPSACSVFSRLVSTQVFTTLVAVLNKSNCDTATATRRLHESSTNTAMRNGSFMAFYLFTSWEPPTRTFRTRIGVKS
jgi:hypothetical protein